MTWEIFLGIIALAGFIVTVTTPMIKLNTSITKLNETIGSIREIVEKNDEDNKESHKRIYNRLENHDNVLNSHNERITKIEGSSERRTEQIKDLEKETATQEGRIIRIEERIQHTDEKINQHINSTT